MLPSSRRGSVHRGDSLMCTKLVGGNFNPHRRAEACEQHDDSLVRRKTSFDDAGQLGKRAVLNRHAFARMRGPSEWYVSVFVDAGAEEVDHIVVDRRERPTDIDNALHASSETHGVEGYV